MKAPAKILQQSIYLFLILFISYTAMNKMISLESFQVNLLKTGVFDSEYIKLLSYSIISLELTVLLVLIFNSRIGGILLMAMLTTFTIYISLLRVFGRYEVCGCGGILNGLQFKYHFLINIILIGLSYFVYTSSSVYSSKSLANEN